MHAHGYGSCLWDYSFSGLVGGPSDQFDGRMRVLEIFIWKVNMLPTSSFAKLKIPGLIEIDVNHLVSQYFQFSLKILNFKYSLEIVRD